MTAREYLEEYDFEDVVIFDDFDEAFIGVNSRNKAVYDYVKIADILVDRDGLSFEEALDYIDFNCDTPEVELLIVLRSDGDE